MKTTLVLLTLLVALTPLAVAAEAPLAASEGPVTDCIGIPCTLVCDVYFALHRSCPIR